LLGNDFTQGQRGLHLVFRKPNAAAQRTGEAAARRSLHADRLAVDIASSAAAATPAGLERQASRCVDHRTQEPRLGIDATAANAGALWPIADARRRRRMGGL
jgi:hypothetical protein